MINMTKEEKETILAIVAGLPPDDWKNNCKSESQLEHWNQIKITFQIIRTELESHFLGTPSKVKITDSESAEFLTLAIWRYLEIYEVARCGWDYICEFADTIGFKIPSSPGDFLINILQQDCKATFEQCTKYYEFNPRRIASLCRLETKIDRGKANEREKLKYEKEVKKLTNTIGEIPLSVLCLGACLPKRNFNPGLNEALNRLESTNRKIDALNLRAYHPNKRQRAYAWVRGEKVQLHKT